MSEPRRPSLREAFVALTPEPKTCAVVKLIEQLDQEDQMQLSQWLNDPDMTHGDIVRLLKYCGLNIHRNTIADHRKNVCVCSR